MEARSIFRNVLEQVWTMVSAIYRGGGETLLDAGSAPPRHRYWIYLRPYLICLAMDIAATGVAYLFEPITAASNLSLVYLPPILISALSFGLWPSIASSMLGVLLWDYLFLPPKYELNIDDPQDALALLLFLVISLVVSNLAALSLRQRSAIEARAKSTAQLYEFSQQIAAVGSLGAMLNAAISTIGSMMHCEVFVLLTADGATRLSASYPQMRDLDAVEVSLAQAAATGAPVSLAGRHLFMPLQTQRGIIGVVGIDRNQSQSFLPDEESLLSILVDQTAVAIERIQLAETIDQARIETETERLRNAMLTSISHDLRTPLTSIMAAHSILRSLGDACDAATRQELIDEVGEEAERLDRFIGNLLDMTKLESGKMNVRLGPIEVGDALESALARASHLLVAHNVNVELPSDLPMVKADFMLLEQVIFNLIDNSVKYTSPGTIIDISAYAGEDAVSIGVADQGSGIPPHSIDAIFNKFARVNFEDRQRPGTGLGLAICRGFLQAMGGTITADNRQDQRGAIFTIRIAIADA